MTRKQAERRTILSDNLRSLGFTNAECDALIRAQMTLHTWAEHECNGAIQRDEKTGKPYWYNTNTGRKLSRTSDREAGAIKRVNKIVADRNARDREPRLTKASVRPLAVCSQQTGAISWFHQTDPRGCSLYILRPDDVPAGQDPSCYYSRGIAVCF